MRDMEEVASPLAFAAVMGKAAGVPPLAAKAENLRCRVTCNDWNTEHLSQPLRQTLRKEHPKTRQLPPDANGTTTASPSPRLPQVPEASAVEASLNRQSPSCGSLSAIEASLASICSGGTQSSTQSTRGEERFHAERLQPVLGNDKPPGVVAEHVASAGWRKRASRPPDQDRGDHGMCELAEQWDPAHVGVPRCTAAGDWRDHGDSMEQGPDAPLSAAQQEQEGEARLKAYAKELLAVLQSQPQLAAGALRAPGFSGGTGSRPAPTGSSGHSNACRLIPGPTGVPVAPSQSALAPAARESAVPSVRPSVSSTGAHLGEHSLSGQDCRHLSPTTVVGQPPPSAGAARDQDQAEAAQANLVGAGPSMSQLMPAGANGRVSPVAAAHAKETGVATPVFYPERQSPANLLCRTERAGLAWGIEPPRTASFAGANVLRGDRLALESSECLPAEGRSCASDPGLGRVSLGHATQLALLRGLASGGTSSSSSSISISGSGMAATMWAPHLLARDILAAPHGVLRMELQRALTSMEPLLTPAALSLTVEALALAPPLPLPAAAPPSRSCMEEVHAAAEQQSAKVRRMLSPVPPAGGSPEPGAGPAAAPSSGALFSQLWALGEAVEHCSQSEVMRLSRDLAAAASPVGAPMERLAHYVLLSLERRLRGCRASEFIDWPHSSEEEYTSFLRFASREPTLPFGFSSLAAGVLDAAAGQDRVHIIDFACWAGQWPRVIKSLARQSRPCTRLKFTAVTAPPGHPLSLGPVANASGLHSELLAACKLNCISLQFQAIVCTPEDLQASSVQLEAGDAVIMNLSGRLTAIANACVVLPHPRDAALRTILQIQPRAVLMLEWDINQQEPAFLVRYQQALQYFKNIFDSHDSIAPRNDVGRCEFERRVQFRPMLNLLACEAQERVVCSEGLQQLQSRMARIGFAPRPFTRTAEKRILDAAKGFQAGFSIKSDDFNGCSLKWGGMSVISASAWQPKVSPSVHAMANESDFAL